jgi:hypothetical protein
MVMVVQQLKPNVDQFYDIKRQQVQEFIDVNRKSFKDTELRNSAIFDEVRDKVSKGWSGAKNQLVPGISNIDLVSADEHILSLLRDGLKYRDRPKARAAGNSIAALTTRKTTSTVSAGSKSDDLSRLREQAKGRGKEATQAADNLLVAQMKAIRAARGAR